MKKDKPVTKQEMSNALQEVTDTILNGVGEMLKGVEKRIGGLEETMTQRFDQLEAGQRDLQRQVTDLKLDTPTRGELERLQKKVRRYHPAN